MSRLEKLATLKGLVIELNQLTKGKTDEIGEFILDANGKGFILKQRIAPKSYKTLTNYKHHSIREMSRFVRKEIETLT